MWHYTNINALYSILSNRKIWMTDIRYLNDASEYHDGISEFKDILPGLLDNSNTNVKNPQKAIDTLLEMLINKSEFDLSLDPVFIFSLSRSEDQLSQWRAYGKYAIEFDTNYIEESLGTIRQCVYDKQEKKRCARDQAIQSLISIDTDMSNNNGGVGVQSIEAIQRLRDIITTFKNHGFSEENEYRAILPSSDSEYPNNIKFRPNGDMLVPFIEVPISLDCIKGIKVGPVRDQDLAMEAISSFAENIERNWQAEGADAGIEYWLQVSCSEIPFRE